MAVTVQQIDQVAREVLGRKADKKLITMFGKTNTVEELKTMFAGSAEAQAQKGFDAAKYGASKLEYVDPGSLDEKQKEIYDAFVSVKGKNAKMSRYELDTWTKYGSAGRLKAELGGMTRKLGQTSDGREITVFTDGAIKAMGGKFEQTEGDRKGAVVLVPRGTEATGLWKNQGAAGDKFGKDFEGYDVLVRGAKPKSGVVGSTMKAVGFSKGAANSMDRAVGHAAALATFVPGTTVMADELAAIGGGSRGIEARTKLIGDTGKSLGLGRKGTLRAVGYADAAGDMVSSVAAGFADAGLFGGAPVLSSGNQALEAQQREMSGGKADWGKVGASVAIDWLSFGVLKGASRLATLGAGWKTTAGVINVARPYAVTSGKVAVAGGGGKEIAEALGRQLLLGFLPQDAVTQSSAAAAMEYAKTKDPARAAMAGSQAAVKATIGTAQANTNGTKQVSGYDKLRDKWTSWRAKPSGGS